MDRNSSFIFTYVFETKVIFTWNKIVYIETYVYIFIKRVMVFYFMSVTVLFFFLYVCLSICQHNAFQ